MQVNLRGDLFELQIISAIVLLENAIPFETCLVHPRVCMPSRIGLWIHNTECTSNFQLYFLSVLYVFVCMQYVCEILLAANIDISFDLGISLTT